MALTKAQIRDRVASDYLGILALNQSLQNQDKTRIEQGYDEVYGYLKIKGLATWASTGSVPNELVPYVTAMVAHNCYKTYTVSNDRAARIIADFAVAEQNIRELTTSDDVSQVDARDF